MKNLETEISYHLAAAQAEAEAQAWMVESQPRRANFLSRRMAALAMVDADPSDEELFAELDSLELAA